MKCASKTGDFVDGIFDCCIHLSFHTLLRRRGNLRWGLRLRLLLFLLLTLCLLSGFFFRIFDRLRPVSECNMLDARWDGMASSARQSLDVGRPANTIKVLVSGRHDCQGGGVAMCSCLTLKGNTGQYVDHVYFKTDTNIPGNRVDRSIVEGVGTRPQRSSQRDLDDIPPPLSLKDGNIPGHGFGEIVAVIMLEA